VKVNWRRPRGVTSRMRKEKNGWPQLVKVGHGSPSNLRGRHPRGLDERLVHNESDLEGLNSKQHIVRLSATLGERRRLILLDRIKSLNIHIANPGKEETRPVGEEAPAKDKASQNEQSKESVSEKSGEGELEDSAEDQVETTDKSEVLEDSAREEGAEK
jgi:large subunit ribosomal protein L32e